MSGDAQIGLFGEETPVEDFDLPAQLRLLAERERQLIEPLMPFEAGAILHARRGRHGEEERCPWCIPDGNEALKRLREKQAR